MANGVTARFDAGFFRNLVLRQIRQDYLENFTGFAWLLLQPLVLLGVYAFVFTTIFTSRVPDSGDMGFVPWLAVAFWPWPAFSDAILRASNSIIANAALIGKVSFASEQLPLAAVTATFLMHSAGFLAVLLVLQATGTDIHWSMLVVAVPLLCLLWVFACAFALFTSASEVYIRDIAQMLPPFFTFWFFTTPILYGPAMLPEWLAGLMRWNPMTWFMDGFRDALLFGRISWGWSDILWPLALIALAWLGWRYFRRFSGHFEDFL